MAALAFGLHETLPLEVFWGVGLAATGGLIWALVRGVRQFCWPSREEALARLDTTLPGRPIAALNDTQALGRHDAGSSKVWRAHVARMAERARNAVAVAPDLRIAERDPIGLRIAAVAALVVALLFGSLWRIAEVPNLVAGNNAANAGGGPSWEGWAEPPNYTGKPSLYLNSINAAGFDLPQGSRITLRLYGSAETLQVEETVSGDPPIPIDVASTNAPAETIASVRAVDFNAVQSGQLKITGDSGREWAGHCRWTTVPSCAGLWAIWVARSRLSRAV